MIMVGAGQLLHDSSNITRNINAQTNVQEELRTAAAIMNEEIQRAYYVFPPQNTATQPSVIKTQEGTDVPVDWSYFTLGTSIQKTGINENTNFTVNIGGSSSNPQILAMITAPRDPTVQCLTSTSATPTSADLYTPPNSTAGVGCYQFVAYYAVFRPKVTRGLAGNLTTSSELLNEDTANSSRLALMEFRMNLYSKVAGSPSTDWGEVGCQFRPGLAKCTTSPTSADPDSLIQTLTTSIPALTCYKFCPPSPVSASLVGQLPKLPDAQRFAARIKKTVEWINTQAPNISPSLLVDYIDETQSSGNQGFFVSMPAETYDARGVFQVRLRLKGKIRVDGRDTTFPSEPISVYATPRNIAPLL